MNTIRISSPASHVYLFPISVPLPVRYTNVYALDTGTGFVLIDAGMDVAQARDEWRSYAKEFGLRPGTVKALFVTHFHPDHLGLAHWLSEMFQTPVYMVAGESRTVRQLFTPQIDHAQRIQMYRHFYLNQGLPEETWTLWEQLDVTMQAHLTLPKTIHPLQHDEYLRFGQLSLRILEQGGHTDHQGLLYLADQNLLFTGDQVLSRISPNVSLWPEGDRNPLKSYIVSLNHLLELDHPRGMPAHEALIDDVNVRIEELLIHHHERNARVKSILSEEPLSAYEVTHRLFTRPLDPYQLRFAMGEALAHLEYLRSHNVLKLDTSTTTWRYDLA